MGLRDVWDEVCNGKPAILKSHSVSRFLVQLWYRATQSRPQDDAGDDFGPCTCPKP